MIYTYDDGLCPGGRQPRLYLANGGNLSKFSGQNIPGICVITAQKYTKNGKWSSTEWTLDLAPGIRPIHLLSPLHRTWGDHFTSWGAAAEHLGLPIEVVQALVKTEYPETAERLNKVEEFALANEAKGETTETVVISFGSPTNRQRREGYWSSNKTGRASDGTEVEIAPGANADGSPNWSKPTVVSPDGAEIISSRHRPGMHGGYVTVEVSVPIKDKE